ncbi:Putative membrane protein mmpL11 [Actinoplanes sp. SE50]|uniref:MMPL family transporter n=1 Tax=unclassified Actinoplanes TaxID=2626549 RepID=UPI00023EC3E4|nr:MULTISPECIES: MMPL family transporter [unclassified Actinoplanes]AEV81914.1 Putative membrane protein mmpL11 [Actinoplanes sp. SE50/110]ATO80314.1 Putative membrane protein mmpL11 [Actinoplanes sp. SE50]SLL97719.1 Putative membrane protein mmpL11 [Actinoplanes sp. SE50/110]
MLLLERMVGWSARHPKKVIVGWILLVAVAVLVGGSAGSGAKTTDAGEAGQAQSMIRAQKVTSSYTENVLIEAQGRDKSFLGTPDLESAATDLSARIKALPGATSSVVTPLDNEQTRAALVSKDGKSGLVSFTIPGPGKDADKHFADIKKEITAVQGAHPGVRLAMAGDISLTSAVNKAADEDLSRAEQLSLPVTLIILIVVFGALVAATVPVFLAATAVLAGLGVLDLVGTIIPANSTVSSVVLLIGMAVGTDYSLFYLRREREERAAGKSATEALKISARTSGHAVVVSGLTVILSLAGLFLAQVDTFNGMAIGTIIVVGLAVLGSVTVLPALLSVLGRRVDSLRVPFLGRSRTTATNSRGWSAIAGGVSRHPLIYGGLALIALVALALPAFGMKLSEPGQLDSLPRSIPAVDAGVRLQQAFPGGADPAQVVVWGTGATSGAADQAVAELRREAAASDLLGDQISATPVGSVLSIKVPLAGSGTDDTSVKALETLRTDVLPKAFANTPGLKYAVGGRTAGLHDFADVLQQRTAWVVAFVLVLAFIVLVVAFRAPLVAAVSMVLNLLAIGAAMGIVVLGFQKGGFAGLLGFSSFGGVVNWLPLFMFVILFGLSMDYHVFILSRVRERWARGESAKDSVVHGVGSSAGVVTSAAVVMIAVFAMFATLSGIEYKMLGVGMAVAILIDATIVRGVLLPATLSLLGDRAWSLRGRPAVVTGSDPVAESAHAEPTEEAVLVSHAAATARGE